MIEVSVVIPCYNQGPYLGRALESVLRQTCDNWEAIVVDDGSADDTALVAQAFDDPRIHYHYQENRGLSGARNTGIDMARGEYLTFLDADDEWEPEYMIRCLLAFASVPEAPGVYAGNLFIDENGQRLPQQGRRTIEADAFRWQLLEGGFFPVHAAMVPRKVLERCGGFDEKLTSLEDWDLWLRISRLGGMIGIGEPLARYRVYSGSMSTDVERMQVNRLAVLEKHFGPATGDVETWNEEQRYAYAFAHRSAALGFLQEGQAERCWQEMEIAAGYWPAILKRLDTYYELGCGGQPKGYRGRLEPEEVEANGALLLKWLESRSEQGKGEAPADRSKAFGQAYLALGMLAEQAGDWQLGRRYLRQAMMTDKKLMGEKGFVRRLVKLHVGTRASSVLRG